MNINSFSRGQRYSLFLHKRRNNFVYELMGQDSNVVRRLVIQEQLETPLVEATITIRLSPTNERLVEVGDIIFYHANQLMLDYTTEYARKHVFYVMKINKTENAFEKVIICRNSGHWLMRNAYYFMINEGETTASFITRTCNERGVDIDSIVPTSYKHQPQFFQNSSLFEAWYQLLTVNILKERLLYNFRISDVGVVLERIREDGRMWLFESNINYTNMLNPRHEVSILNPDFTNIAIAVNIPQITQNKFTGIFETVDDISVKHKRINQESVDLYGEFPTEIDTTSYGKPEEIVDRLQDIVNNGEPVDDIMFRTYAINSLKPTDRILIHYPNFNTGAIYFIESLTTTIEDKEYWHDIHATKRTDVQPELIAQLSIGTSEQQGVFREVFRE